jgi:hypothetical protein
MNVDSNQLMISPRDVRKLASNVSNCKEMKSNEYPDILSFLRIDALGEPARIQVYCRTGTVGTCRVVNEEVREIFQRKCTLRQVHEILSQPMDLPTVDPDMFDDIDVDEERQPKGTITYKNEEGADSREDRELLKKDEQVVDIGLTILASEFDHLMSNFKSLLRDRQRREKKIEDLEAAKERQRQMNQNPTQNRQKIAQMQQQQGNQVHMISTPQMKGTSKMTQKQMQQVTKQQMRKQVHMIRQQKGQQRRQTREV